MTCCIEKSSIFAAAFGKCIYKVSNIQYYFNQKNMNYSCRKTIVPMYSDIRDFLAARFCIQYTLHIFLYICP